MTIDISKEINGYDGKPLQLDGEVATVRGAILLALNSFQQQERPTGEEKARIYALSMKLVDADAVELNLSERTLIKNRAELILLPVTMGPVLAAIEIEDQPEP